MLPRSLTATLGLLALLFALGGARTVSAQTGLGGSTGTTTTSFTPDDFRIVVQEQPGTALSDFNLQRFFNISNCRCATPTYLFFTFTTSGFQKRAVLPQGSVEFWVGQACNDNTTGLRASRCAPLKTESGGNTMVLSDFANSGGVVLTTNAQVLSQTFGQSATTSSGTGGDTGSTGTVGPSGPEACETGLEFTQNIWLLIKFSTSATTGYDVTQQLNISTIDLSPPPAPVPQNLGGSWPGSVGGSEAVIAGWNSIDTSAVPDILGYQVLCDRGGALQVFKNGTFSPGFTTCPGALTTSEPLDAGIHILDPNFVCSPLLSPLATSYRVKILENGVNYGVGVVAIDKHYNASTPFVGYAAPQPTLSFYDVYRNGDETNNGPGQHPDPGKATGGYCAVGGSAPTRAGAGAAAVAGVTLAVALFARRRRKGRRR